MQPSPGGNYVEAIDQWKLAIRRMSSPLPRYEEAKLGAASAIWGNVPFPLVNQAFVDQKLTQTHEMEAVADSVCEFASQREFPWMFAVCEPWLPAGASNVLRAHGLAPAMHVTYMTATELLPPVRPEPQIEYRRIDSLETARLTMDMNLMSYDMPLESGRSAVAGGELFLKDAFGYIAYVEDKPVSTATALDAGDCLNAICVATPPPYERRGYAEAVLRHSLNEARRATGIEQMVLHATDAGFPIYKRMGFNPVVSMMIWAPVHPEA